MHEIYTDNSSSLNFCRFKTDIISFRPFTREATKEPAWGTQIQKLLTLTSCNNNSPELTNVLVTSTPSSRENVRNVIITHNEGINPYVIVASWILSDTLSLLSNNRDSNVFLWISVLYQIKDMQAFCPCIKDTYIVELWHHPFNEFIFVIN